jgi:hypothetical protein
MVTKKETPSIETIGPGRYRLSYRNKLRLEISDPRLDNRGSLKGFAEAYHGDIRVWGLTIDLLDSRERERFQMQASYKNGAVNWLVPLDDAAVQLRKLLTAPHPEGPADDKPLAVRAEPVEPFPMDVFPAPLARLIREGAEALPCPPEFIGVPMLAVLGGAIGTSRVVEVKAGWREGPRIYAAVVADPGSKKSPALDLAMKPLYQQQETHKEAHELAKIAHQQQLADYEVQQASWRKAVNAGEVDPSLRPTMPDEPHMPQVWTSDATIEAFAELLERNPRGLMMVRDELTGWVRAMNQYKGGKGADRQAWLSFWSGAPVIVNRKNRKSPIMLNLPFVGVVGCMPPEVLGDLADERGREDGFVHRVLFAFPEQISPRWTDAVVSEATIQGYTQVVQRLLALKDHEGAGPRVVTFTPKGHAAYVELVNELYALLDSPDCPASMRGPLAKLEGYAARLALILQMSRLAAGETEMEAVEEVSVIGAAALVHYFRVHAKRVYAQLACTPEDKEVSVALSWILAHGGSASLRELVRNNVAGVKSATDAHSLLVKLQDRRYGVVTEGDKNRVVFTLHAS